MLSADMMRYVELHHAAGFKFRTQHQMLTSFVAFAEQHGDEFVRVDRAIELGGACALRKPNGASSSSKFGGSHWRCERRTVATKSRRPMPWAEHYPQTTDRPYLYA